MGDRARGIWLIATVIPLALVNLGIVGYLLANTSWRPSMLWPPALVLLLGCPLMAVASIWRTAYYSVIAGLAYPRRERYLRAALAGDDGLVPRASVAWEPEQALKPGATITITTHIEEDYAKSLLSPVLLPILLACIAPGVFFGGWSVKLGVALLAPSIVYAGVWIRWLRGRWTRRGETRIATDKGIVTGCVQEIAADDMGITVRRTGEPDQAIAWNEVCAFLEVSSSRVPYVGATYWLLGNGRGIWFTLGDRGEAGNLRDARGRVAAMTDPRMAVNERLGGDYWERFPDGTFIDSGDRYEPEAWRLLNTIAARVRVPLRAPPTSARYSAWVAHWLTVSRLKEQNQDRPLQPAGDPWRPTVEAIARAQAEAGLLILRSKRWSTDPWMIFPSLSFFVGTTGFYAGLIYVHSLLGTAPTLNDWYSLAYLSALAAALSLVFLIVVIWPDEWTLRVDETGISYTTRAASAMRKRRPATETPPAAPDAIPARGLPKYIPWSQVKRWVVSPPTPYVSREVAYYDHGTRWVSLLGGTSRRSAGGARCKRRSAGGVPRPLDAGARLHRRANRLTSSARR